MNIKNFLSYIKQQFSFCDENKENIANLESQMRYTFDSTDKQINYLFGLVNKLEKEFHDFLESYNDNSTKL